MKCGHCLSEFHANISQFDMQTDQTSHWVINRFNCPACLRFNIYLLNGDFFYDSERILIPKSGSNVLVYPKSFSRVPMSSDIPDEFLDTYKEACLVLADSPMASAALSRRALQQILRDKGGFRAKGLSEEIQQAIDSKTLPSYVTESIDAIRNIGNFAAHPLKSTNSGEIIKVEAGEAEWNLDVLEMLYDIYFVQPAIIQKKREELNKKLADAGKPPMK